MDNEQVAHDLTLLWLDKCVGNILDMKLDDPNKAGQIAKEYYHLYGMVLDAMLDKK